MAGIGLADAVRSYQQGNAWRQQQGEIARQQQQRDAIEAANREATGVIERSKGEWAASGAPGQYKPNSMTMFQAAEARGNALAKAGLWDQFMQNEASIAPMRMRARAEALQQYEVDGDFDRLARTVYPTLFDGRQIKGSERVRGPQSEGEDMPGPPTFKFKLSDGAEQVVEPSKFVSQLKASLVDPVQAAKNEAMLNLEREKARILADRQIEVENVKGKNARQLQEDKAVDAMTLASVNNAAAGSRTTTSAEATRYSADRRVEAANATGSRRTGAPRDDDGMTPADRIRQNKDAEVAARSEVRDLRAELNEARKTLSGTYDGDEKKRLSADIARIEAELQDAQKRHREAQQRMVRSSDEQPASGPALADLMRRDADATGQPVQFDIGGVRGSVAPSAGLSSVAPPKGGPEKAASAPPASALREGVRTKFKNGQVWTLRNGQPVRIN